MNGRPPDPLLLGLDGPELRVPVEVAVLLWPAVAAWWSEHERMGARSKLGVVESLYVRWRHVAALQQGFASESAAGERPIRARPSRHDQQQWLTSREAAEVLGVTSQRVGQLIAAGEIDADKPGRDWRIDGASLRAYQSRAAERSA